MCTVNLAISGRCQRVRYRGVDIFVMPRFFWCHMLRESRDLSWSTVLYRFC